MEGASLARSMDLKTPVTCRWSLLDWTWETIFMY